MAAKKLHHVSSKLAVYLQAAVLAMPLLLGTVPKVGAAQLENRSIRVSTAQLGAEAEHLFLFDVASVAPIGSISFMYCSNSPLQGDPCVPPTGLDLSNVSLDDQTNNVGFTYEPAYSTVETLVITRPVDPGIPGASTYTFSSIINPTTPGQTTFVRIATYATPDATGPVIDYGSVTFATQDVFRVDAYVPPYLTFCVGVYVTLNCNSTTGNYINIGELGTNRTATGQMQFSGATNDPGGYTTYLNGNTMTSGNNIINALVSNNTSITGASQFGLNLRANSNPSIGLEPIGLGSSTPTAGYGTPNSYRFVNGEAITTTSFPTDFKIFTASYIVNVSQNQPPGIYVATMTYTAVAAF